MTASGPPRVSRIDLEGKCAVVTGASAGLGAECSRALHACGARVAAVGRRSEALSSLVADLPGSVAVVEDLYEPDSPERLIAQVRAELGPVDILINNAGFAGNGTKAEQETQAELDALFRLNVLVPYRLAQLVFPDMVQRGGGSIVNVTSISGLRAIGKIPQAGYVASKHALTGLTRELALQWGRHSIRVNAVAPGYFETNMTAALYRHERIGPWITSRTALPGTAKPSDIVGAILFLVGDGSDWVTGQTIAVDGGWSAT